VESENERLRARVEELEETVRQLRSIAAQASPLPDWVPYLTRHESAILQLFLAREVVTIDAMEAIIHEGDTRSGNLLSVYVYHLRKKLAKSGVKIETIFRRGYRMPPASKALFAQQVAA